MRDPFKIDSPTCLSVSGGRTSGYMLWRVLEANDGALPPEAIACFANTGKEEEATLRFVRDMSVHWNVPIVWVEYRNDEQGYAIVDFDSASRNGEPFAAIIAKRQYLPNPVTRFCTSELKLRTMHKYQRARWANLGLDAQDIEWDQFIGIRADEQRRVAKIRARGHSNESKRETMCMPLADAGVSVHDVTEFWARQPFNLELPTYNGRTLAGNCDLCFLKPNNQIRTLIAQKPERAVWWAAQEALALTMTSNPRGAVFRSDRASYAAMLKNVGDQTDFLGYDEEAIACFCGD